MKSTLLVFWILPPPSAGADVLALTYGARTRLAAYRRIALVVQFIVRHTVLTNVLPHIVLAPSCQRIDLYQTVVDIPLNHVDIASGYRLRCTQTANPHVEG